MSDTDLELLASYARHRAEDAFAEIVRRHLGLVYSAALRQVRSPQLAEEVTQSVFTSLAREAGRLRPDTILAAWLYQVAHHTAANVVRGEIRRQMREQIASEMMNATAADWTSIEPLLDEAMHALDETDRAVVLLRYFENKSLCEVGASLGTSENAAQKRLARAVERLRDFFAKRGVTVGASGLAVVISANAVQAAPLGLAGTISSVALASAGTASGVLPFLKLMTVTKLKFGAVSVIVLMALIFALQLRREGSGRATVDALAASSDSASGAQRGPAPRPGVLGRVNFLRTQEPAPAVPPEQIVAGKLSRFANSRRDLAHALARRHGVEVSDIVERFFAAAEAGRWEEMQALFDSMSTRRKQQPPARDLDAVWGPIHETLGVAQETQKWPAQKLLDYGNAVLDALRPGMVYVGGTDPGRFIPTLLNETSDGERRIVLSQNPLGDRTYLDYVSFLYGDRFSMVTPDDSERAFQNYLADAQNRLEHDQQFPDEPRQVRPGENIRVIDGKVDFSGAVAWMAINEQLLRTLMEKNPDASFAIEQSYPFTSMYADTRPLGPIMELRVQDEQNVLTHERATQSADYWRATAQQLLADPEAPAALNTRMAYAKMASEQAALLDHHHHVAEAEQAYRSASEMWPSCPEAVFRLANLLIGQHRLEEAFPVVEAALAAEPGSRQFLNLKQKLTQLRQNR